MRKFSMPSIEVRNFSREVLLDASSQSTNMSAATSKTISIGGQTVNLNGSNATIAQASMN